MTRANRVSNLLALVLATSLLLPTSAFGVSLPYIEDVGHNGIQFSAAGLEKSLCWKAKDESGKSIHVDKISARSAGIFAKNGQLVKISVKGAEKKWKSIGFRAYKTSGSKYAPRVDDVNYWGRGKSLLTLYAPRATKFKVLDVKTGKSVKVELVKKGVAFTEIKNGREYKISAKSAGKWRSIGYIVY